MRTRKIVHALVLENVPFKEHKEYKTKIHGYAEQYERNKPLNNLINHNTLITAKKQIYYGLINCFSICNQGVRCEEGA